MKAPIRHLCNHLDVRQQMFLRNLLLANRDAAEISPNAIQAQDFNHLAALIAECAMEDDAELAAEVDDEMRERAKTF